MFFLDLIELLNCVLQYLQQQHKIVLSSIMYYFPLPEKGHSYTTKYFPYSLDVYLFLRIAYILYFYVHYM